MLIKQVADAMRDVINSVIDTYATSLLTPIREFPTFP